MGLSVMSKVYRAACESRSAACMEISRQPCYLILRLMISDDYIMNSISDRKALCSLFITLKNVLESKYRHCSFKAKIALQHSNRKIKCPYRKRYWTQFDEILKCYHSILIKSYDSVRRDLEQDRIPVALPLVVDSSVAIVMSPLRTDLRKISCPLILRPTDGLTDRQTDLPLVVDSSVAMVMSPLRTDLRKISCPLILR